MDEKIRDYFQDELSCLLEAGAGFRRDHKAAADELRLHANRCDDPHVERLLEGFALIAARIRAKLDDEFPEITNALMGMLYPHLQRPVPSASIVQFSRSPGLVKPPPPGGDHIPAQVRLRSLPEPFRDCRFRTVYPVSLWPLEVVDARLVAERLPSADRRPGDRAMLALTLRTEVPGGLGAFEGFDRLRFYLGGESRVGFALHELLGSAVTRAEVRSRPGRGEPDVRKTIPAEKVQTVGFGPDEGLFPYPERSPRGLRLIQEYLHFPKKFLFIDVAGLEGVAGLRGAAEFDLLFFLNRPPRDELPIGPDNFLLGCTPVVNLFDCGAKPIPLTQTRTEYPVVPLESHAEVYSINRVVGSGSRAIGPEEYLPLYAFSSRVPGSKGRASTYWYAVRRPPQADAGANLRSAEAFGVRTPPPRGAADTDVSLMFATPGFDPRLPAADAVTVSLTCTNGDHAAAIQIDVRGGDLEPDDPVPAGLIHFIEAVVPPVRPPLGGDGHWRLISNMSLNYLSLVDLPPADFEDEPDGPRESHPEAVRGRDALVGLLDAYNFAGSDAVRARFEGIASVSSRRVMRVTPRRALVGGVEVAIQFDESRFVDGGAFLLACVLERFFGLYVSLNSFAQTVALDSRGEVIKKWPPRIGEKTLL